MRQKHGIPKTRTGPPPGSSGQQQAERSGIGADGGGKQHVLKLYMLRKPMDKWWLIGSEKG